MGGSLRNPWVAVVLGCGAAWAALLVALAWGRFAGDGRGFLYAGAAFARPPVLANVPVLSQYGYDGQFYAVLATDPLLLRAETRGYLDAPAYRATRVGVPLVAWLVSLGQPVAAVWAYLLLCWGGALALVGVLAAWLRERGVPAGWAVAVGASGGVAASMLRATPDAAALALALGGLWCAARGRLPGALAMLTGAALCRETLVLLALGAALVAARGGRRREAAAYALLPAGAYLTWRGALAAVTGGPLLEGGGNLGLPLAWVAPKVAHLFGGGAGAVGMELWGVLAVAAGVGGAAALARRALGQAPVAGYLLFALLALLLSHRVMVEAYAYTRVLLPLAVLGLVAAAECGPLARLWLYFQAAFQALAGLAMVRVELGVTFPALANLKGYLFR